MKRFVCFAATGILLLGGCGSSESPNRQEASTASEPAPSTEQEAGAIAELEFLDSEAVELEVGDTAQSYFTVMPLDGSVDEIDFISTSPEVATFEYDSTALRSYIYYNITAVSAGETTVYAQSKDGTVKTEEITVTVSGEDESVPSPLDSSVGGIQYELLYESDWTEGDTNPKIFEYYADIDVSGDGWREQVKEVISHLIVQNGEYADVVYRIYDDTGNVSNNQTTYTNVVAAWWSKPVDIHNESVPTITFYPTGGFGDSTGESEPWNP